MDTSAQPQASATFPAGTILDGRYRIRKPIGAGGMGSIFVAEHLKFGRDVAVKVLSNTAHGTSQAHERFTREAKAVCHLQHPNLVTYHDFGTDPDSGVMYLILELLKGDDLAAILKRTPNLEPQRIIHILSQLCDALSEAHQHGVIHRDLKPANVMLVQRGDDPDFVKLIDFGIVRVVQEEMGGDNLTGAGMLVGTPSYLAPEYIQFQQVDHRVDLYALGVIAYELVSGLRPFVHRKAGHILRMHVQAPVPPLTYFRNGQKVPRALQSAIMQALEKHPDDRQPDIRTFKTAICAAPLSTSTQPKRRRAPHHATDIAIAVDSVLETTSADSPSESTIERDETAPYQVNIGTTPTVSKILPSRQPLPAQRLKPNPAPQPVLSKAKAPHQDSQQGKRWIILLGSLLTAFGTLLYLSTPTISVDISIPSMKLSTSDIPPENRQLERQDNVNGANAALSPSLTGTLAPLQIRLAATESSRTRSPWTVTGRAPVVVPAYPRRKLESEISGLPTKTRASTRKQRSRSEAKASTTTSKTSAAPTPTKKRYRVQIVARPFGVIRYQGRVLGEDYVVTSLPAGKACFSVGAARKVSCRVIDGPKRLSLPAK